MKLFRKSFLFFCLLFSLLFLNSSNLHSQNQIDRIANYYELSNNKSKSIKQRLYYIDKVISLSRQNNNIEFLLNGLNRKSYLYTKLGYYNTAITISKQLLKESTKAKDTSKVLLSYKNLADYSRLNDSLFQAFNYYQEHKLLSLKQKDSIGAIRDLRFMASIQYKLGVLHESESTAVEGITILDALKETDETLESKIGLYNHLGIIYKELGNYRGALELYNKLLKSTKNESYINIILNNKANVYKEQENYELSFNAFETIYKNSLKIKDTLQMARALNNLGFVKGKLNMPDALPNMIAALSFRTQKNELHGMYSSFISLAEYYKDRNDPKQVKQYAQQAYAISLATKNYQERLEALSFLVETDGNKNIIEFKTLSDSVSKAKQLNENKYAYIKYNYLKKEKEAQDNALKFKDSELNTEKEKLNKTIYKSIAIFGLLLTVFLYFIIKAKHKKDKLQQVYNTEIRISKKVHDEVANDVYHIMTNLQSNHGSKDDVLDDLETVYNKTRDISKENSMIDLQGNYAEHLKDLLLSYQNENIKIVTKDISKTDWSLVPDVNKISLFRVLQELMTNMRKHSKATLVAVTFHQTGKKTTIDYKDNGMGCNLIKNNGLHNTENRMASIKGTITFESKPTKGFKVQIKI